MSNPKTVKGPGARGMRGGQGSRNPGRTLKRLLAYIWKDYKIHCVAVAVSIAVSALTGVIGNLFLRSLIDDYILPFWERQTRALHRFSMRSSSWHASIMQVQQPLFCMPD